MQSDSLDSANTLRMIRFPEDHSLGTLYTRDGSDAGWIGWELHARRFRAARGEVIVPKSKDIALLVSKESLDDLSPLLSLGSNDLQAVVIPGLETCRELPFYLQALSGLDVLWVEVSRMDDADLEYLKSLSNLKWLYIVCDQLQEERLARLRATLSSCTISLAGRIEDSPLQGLIQEEATYTAEEMMHKANEAGFRDTDGRPFTDVNRFLRALERDATGTEKIYPKETAD